MAYHLNVVQTACNSIVHLKFVESIIPIGDLEDKVVEKLKADRCFGIRTVSGAEYILSMQAIAKIIGSSDSVDKIAQDIYDKWTFIQQEK